MARNAAFRGPLWFLSNMYPCRVRIRWHGEELAFKCVEAAYLFLEVLRTMEEIRTAPDRRQCLDQW